MDPTVASALVISLGSLGVALITARQNRKGAATTNAISERVVNREDFESIVKELRQSLADVRANLGAVKKDLEVEVKARKEADARAERAERRAEAAEKRAERLERRVTQLEQALRDNQMPIPPPD